MTNTYEKGLQLIIIAVLAYITASWGFTKSGAFASIDKQLFQEHAAMKQYTDELKTADLRSRTTILEQQVKLALWIAKGLLAVAVSILGLLFRILVWAKRGVMQAERAANRTLELTEELKELSDKHHRLKVVIEAIPCLQAGPQVS